MANGDIRKCSFCLNTYVVSANQRCTEVCSGCVGKHRASKKGRIASEREADFYRNMGTQYQQQKAQVGIEKVRSLSICFKTPVVLNWSASK